MSKPIRILIAILASLAIGGMFACQDVQKNESTYQQHQATVVLTDFFCGFLSGLVFYFGSGWHERRKERKFQKVGNDKFYEDVAHELQKKTLVAGLWTKAFAEMGGDDVKARALYIKYRVAQLAEASRQQLEEDRIAKRRQEDKNRIATKATEEKRHVTIEAAKRQSRTKVHRFAHMILASICGFLTICMGLGGLAAIFVQDNTLQEKIYVPILSFFIAFCFGLATKHCYKETQ